VDTYPADEKRISEVERGRCWKATLALPPGKAFAVGDTILFALAHSLAPVDGEISYVKGGDSVRVLLTEVTDLESEDPATGQAMFRITWEPLGQAGSPGAASRK